MHERIMNGKLFTDMCEGLPQERDDAKRRMIAFNKTTPDEIDERLKSNGYEVVSGPRTTGDGYYESCIIGIEGNQIELTV